jgi:GT2 family glycosyltransferase/2-polyprenyl-3-methyl-5-hydroxy-6-metoxy-1,4-benzoquinol methylase
MQIQRVAIIFDKDHRPETTGTYCLNALRDLVAIEHFRPAELDRIPRTGFDLYLNIDEGLSYRFPPDLRPSAWWVIDTHLQPDWALQKGQDFDWVFAAQRDGAARLRDHGIPADWLPLACDPNVHRPHSVPKRWDVGFVGWVYPGPRSDLLTLIQHQYSNSFVGQCYFEDYARTCSESRIGFNHSIKNDVNMRVFETLACGTLLLTNDLHENGQNELFVPDKHLAVYQSSEDLLDKIAYYLRHEDLRERIAQAGLAEVVRRHTYRHRMESLLRAVSRKGVSLRITRPATPIFRLEHVEIVIKTFLRPQALLRLLRSLQIYYPQIPVSVADDGGLREAADAESRHCCRLIDETPHYRVYTLPFAAGVAVGRNLLFEKATHPFVLLLDDDFCFTGETRIEQLGSRLAENETLGVVAGACIDVVDGTRQPRKSGGTMQIIGDTLHIDSAGWRNADEKLRDYVPNFALFRREVFADVEWQGGIGGEHYDFYLQLLKTRWQIAHDQSVTIDHYHFTPGLPGYEAHRGRYPEAQQWLLKKWNLRQIVQDGQTIVALTRAEDEEPPVPNATHSKKSATPGISAPTGSNRLLEKDPLYFDFSRPEILALIPTSARSVLDIGCGAGAMGRSLKRRQQAKVVGIELQQAAAAIAKRRLDAVIERNIEDAGLAFEPGEFDCVVCADVLEHLRRPAEVLARIRRWLSPDGILVMSVPNTRHHSVISSLIDGNWTYEAAGLLDDDHVRFFTRREVEKLIERSGFVTDQFHGTSGPGYEDWVANGQPGDVRIGGLQIVGLAPEVAAEFFVYQFLVTARAQRRRPRGMTSIIIVTHNQWGYTQECLNSLRQRTDEWIELIFVDNGSTDGTVERLRQIADWQQSVGSSPTSIDPRLTHGGMAAIRLIENAENRGFPAAVNQGLHAAHGEYVVLLNNDTVLTTGWLTRLHEAFDADPAVGLAGPCSNNVSGSQRINVEYRDLAALDGFAWDWGKRHRGVVEDTDRLIGFCLAIRRAVIEQIGLFDERFGIGCFEDDDYCLRALQAGWRAVIARASFVHHFGNRTFAGSGVDLGEVLKRNREKFTEKWNGIASENGPGARNGNAAAQPEKLANGQRVAAAIEDRPVPPVPAPGLPAPEVADDAPALHSRFTLLSHPTDGLLLRPKSIRLSLCMIVRDNEATIGPALNSIASWVDEIIVVDTGSKDRTPEICRQFGAELHNFAWCDDFSAARNESLKYARGDWVFWMDSDDTIPVECGRQLRSLVDSKLADYVLAFVMQVHCPSTDQADERDVTIVDHVKLFRNHRDIRFEGRIHEQLLPSIRRLGGEVEWTDLYVVHSGSDHSLSGWQRKLERDLRILELELKDSPDHPFVLFNLGMTYADAARFDGVEGPLLEQLPELTRDVCSKRAVTYLEQSIAASTPDESHLRKAYALLVSTLWHVNQYEPAWEACAAGLKLYPEDKELLFRSAMLHHQFGRLPEAVIAYQKVLDGHEERHFSSVDSGLAGFKARHNLAIVFEDLGMLRDAEAQWRQILSDEPRYAPARHGLSENLARQSQRAIPTNLVSV